MERTPLLTSFQDFGLADPISRALKEENYLTPTPIQAQTIPLALTGRDVVGIAQTGTGKTAAFALPILHRILENRIRPQPKTCRVLVLSPTRELSGQILDSFNAYGRHIRLTSALAIGGVPMGRQVRSVMQGVEVLVATPGRLLDLVQSNGLKLGQVEFLVLDEADRMLDMGFINDIRKIVGKLPIKRQTLFFSATMPKDIAELAEAMLRDPARVAVTPVASTVERITQRIIQVDFAAKPGVLAQLLKQEPVDRALVFTRTKHGADKVVKGARQGRHPRPTPSTATSRRTTASACWRRSAPARSAPWSPPTSPPAASTSTASAMWSISTCRTCRKPMSTASAAPRAPAPTASRSR